MIAISALRAIWAPKVGPIAGRRRSLLPSWSPNCLSSVGWTAAVLLGRNLPLDLDRRWRRTSGFVDLLDLGVAGAVDAAVGERGADVVDARPPRSRLAWIRVPGLEVDAEVELLGRERDRADRQDHPRDREEPLAGAGEVEVPLRALLVRRSEGLGERRNRVRPEHAEDRLGEEDRGEQRDDRPDAEREGEALDPRRGEHEEDERRDQRDHVRVDDRRDALASSPSAIAEGIDLPCPRPPP